MRNKRAWSVDSLVLIVSIILLAQLLAYVVPQGRYERVPYPENPGRTMVVAGTYEALGDEATASIPPWHFLVAISDGFAAAQDIIFLVFIVGGVIAVLRETGAIDAGLHRAVAHIASKPWIMIAGCLVLFSTASYTIGMGEEYVPLVPIIVSMCLAMRMDAVVAMGVVWIPYGIGWACAGTNPFGVLIAQDLAGVALTSGWAVRLAMMAVFLAVAFHHIYSYARRVRADPAQSLVSHVDYSSGFEVPPDIELTARRSLILILAFAGLAFFVTGVATYSWYIAELNAVFIAIGLTAAGIARLAPGHASRTFVRGASEMTAAALLIGFARTIEVVLSDGQIIDTMIHTIASVLEGAGPEVSALGMLLVQSLTNFFIPSGSGQAFVTMPIMAPLATLTGVPQQTAVLAYQFGDGFSNMLVPTSALVMGALALGRVPYTAWLRFAAPLLAKFLAVACVLLVISIHLGPGLGFG